MIQAIAIKNGFRHDGISIFVEDLQNQMLSVANPITLKSVEMDEMYTETTPTFTLCLTAAQKLIDDLWDCGLRPSEGSGSAGQLAAVQNHLADMRKLLSKVPLVGEQK